MDQGAAPRQARAARHDPPNPNVRYRDVGWVSWGDWLGTGTVHNADRVFWSFRRARAFVRALGLRNRQEYLRWRSGGLTGKPPRPLEVPTNPNRTYAEWVDWSDWLGKPAGSERRWRSFEEARAFARSLGLTCVAEWKAYAAGRRPDLPPKPADVPASPEPIYRNDGWSGFADWLHERLSPADGRSRRTARRASRPAEQAR